MNPAFFVAPQAANHAAHRTTKVIPRQKSKVYVHIPVSRHDVAMKRRLLVYNVKEQRGELV